MRWEKAFRTEEKKEEQTHRVNLVRQLRLRLTRFRLTRPARHISSAPSFIQYHPHVTLLDGLYYVPRHGFGLRDDDGPKADVDERFPVRPCFGYEREERVGRCPVRVRVVQEPAVKVYVRLPRRPMLTPKQWGN